MALPTQDVTWSTTGTKTDPGSAQKLAGWAYRQKVPYSWLNWLFGAWGDFINYFSADIVEGRDAAYGYQYDTGGGEVAWNLSPTCANYQDTGVQAVTIDTSGTPTFARATTAGVTTAIAKIGLTPFLQFVASDEPTQPSVTVTNLRIRAKKGAVGGQVIVRIMEQAPFSSSGAGAAAAAYTWTPTLGTGFTDENIDVSVELFSPNFCYWVEVEIGTAGTNTDTGVQGLKFTVSKEAVEGKPTTPA
jgi:hypothetical protein